MEVKKLFWELVFDWIISSNQQQMSALLNATTFLVLDGLHALFYMLLLNCDITSTTHVWAKLKHLFLLLQCKTKQNTSIADQNERKNLRSLFSETFCKCGRVNDVNWMQTSNTIHNLNLGIAFCLFSWSDNTLMN